MDWELSLARLAERLDEPPSRLREWWSAGLIGAADSQRFTQIDLERARLVQLFLRCGIGLDVIAEEVHGGELRTPLQAYLDALFPGGAGPVYSLEEAAVMVGLPVDEARRVWAAAGQQRDFLNENDVAWLCGIKTGFEVGFPADACIQLIRVWADALGGAAEAASRLFHFYVHLPLDAERGASCARDGEVAARRESLQPLLEPAILYFHRMGLARAQPADMVMHLQDAAGLLDPQSAPGELLAAVLFVDLVSFTPLAEAMGNEKAAEVLDRFAGLVREAAAGWHGQVVKQIGDGFMLTFLEPRSAVECALQIEEASAAAPQFPAVRSGVHWGKMLYREGDYVGSSVNLASRVAEAARRHQVFVTGAVRRQVGGLPAAEFLLRGKQRLRGVVEEVEIYEARRTGDAEAVRLVDPVCGMELGAGEIAARLVIGDREHVFCSDACLRRFAEAPGRYA